MRHQFKQSQTPWEALLLLADVVVEDEVEDEDVEALTAVAVEESLAEVAELQSEDVDVDEDVEAESPHPLHRRNQSGKEIVSNSLLFLFSLAIPHFEFLHVTRHTSHVYCDLSANHEVPLAWD